MRLFLPFLLLLTVSPVKAEQAEINCPGLTTLDMRFCVSQKWKESNHALKKRLSSATMNKWRAATQEVCAAAYAPYRKGTIYPQMVIGCDDRLNRVLLKEFQSLGD